MFNITLADWFLARSEAFKLLLAKFRDHKINTKRAFSAVKQKHNLYEQQIRTLHRRVNVTEAILREMQDEKPKIIKKNR